MQIIIGKLKHVTHFQLLYASYRSKITLLTLPIIILVSAEKPEHTTNT